MVRPDSQGRRAPFFQSGQSVHRQSMRGDHVLVYRNTTDQVLLNDPLQHVGRAGPVPDAIRVNDRYRSLLADLQAVGLGPIDAALSNELEFNQPAFQIFPGLEALLAV